MAQDEKKTGEKKATVRLHNRGKRSHQFTVEVPLKDADNKDVKDDHGKVQTTMETRYFNPGATGTFPADVGNRLRKMYRKEIVSLDDVHEDFTQRKEDTLEAAPRNDSGGVPKSADDLSSFGDGPNSGGHMAPGGLEGAPAKAGGTIGG